MSASDYVGVIVALVAGVACIANRKRMAVVAVKRHEHVFGVHRDPRSFEFGFAAAGAAFIIWALLVLIGAFVYAE